MAIGLIKEYATRLNVEITDDLVENLVKYINDTIKWANDMRKDS